MSCRSKRGLRPASVKAYRDGLRLFLSFLAEALRCRLTQVSLECLSLDWVLRFLQCLEERRHNHRRTRNHRLTILRTFFESLARRCPELLAVAQQVAAIPVKRVAPPETRFLEGEQIEALFRHLPSTGRLALRDRAMLLLIYNTGARVQELADLRAEHLELGLQRCVRLHGKGDKWRVCPLWPSTVDLLTRLLQNPVGPATPTQPVFASRGARPLTPRGQGRSRGRPVSAANPVDLEVVQDCLRRS